MTRDELYPIIDEVLHERMYPFTDAGSYWIERAGGEPELRIGELAEVLCDAVSKAVGDLTVEVERLRAERASASLTIKRLTAEFNHQAARLAWFLGGPS